MASGGQPHGPDRDGVSAYTLPAGGGRGEDEDECRKNWMKREKRYIKSHESSKDWREYASENAAAQEEMRRIREEIDRNKERFRQLSDKVDKNTMADAETEPELQGLQAGEERRGSNASQAVECCLETMVEQIFALGTGARDVYAQNAPIYFP